MTTTIRAPAAPATPVAVRDAVRAALADRAPLRVVGRGGWLDAGRPVRAARELSLAAVSGVTAYTPGDLTLTALAGTALGEIAAATRAEGQFLALDPWGGDRGSLGATVATASAGPLAHAFGLPRDNVLGVEFVTGTGDLVRGGGRVVKNVAGFDLVRLVAGAWGTLGVLTEVTVRLRALPEADVTLAVVRPDDVVDRLRTLPLAPWAAELLDPVLARALGVGAEPLLLLRLGGNEPSVRAQAALVHSLADAAELPGDVWSRLRVAAPDGAAVVRLSAAPSALWAVWGAARRIAELAAPVVGFVHASVGRGVARCVLPAAPPEAIERAVRDAAFDGTYVFERLPAALWPRLASSPVDDPLSERTRDAFDPHRLLNPGILGERSVA